MQAGVATPLALTASLYRYQPCMSALDYYARWHISFYSLQADIKSVKLKWSCSKSNEVLFYLLCYLYIFAHVEITQGVRIVLRRT